MLAHRPDNGLTVSTPGHQSCVTAPAAIRAVGSVSGGSKSLPPRVRSKINKGRRQSAFWDTLPLARLQQLSDQLVLPIDQEFEVAGRLSRNGEYARRDVAVQIRVKGTFQIAVEGRYGCPNVHVKQVFRYEHVSMLTCVSQCVDGAHDGEDIGHVPLADRPPDRLPDWRWWASAPKRGREQPSLSRIALSEAELLGLRLTWQRHFPPGLLDHWPFPAGCTILI